MKRWYKIVFMGILGSMTIVHAQPVITKMFNNSDFVYQMIVNNGSFGCNKALMNNPFLLNARSYSDEQILIGLKSPSIILRPIAYLDSQSSKLYSFVNAQTDFDEKRIELAFDVWKIAHKTKYKTAQEWFENWVGGDIKIQQVEEVWGYVMNLSRVVVANKKHSSKADMQFSQGVWARLSLGIQIHQNLEKGVIPFVETYVGEGARCKDGLVEEI